ncbi:uncharacterized protein ALTATR162_LOCUS1757 [Alternaria atra]|uniref:Fungal N-terminal domain-containing protein n=1 Tax=Alternaria atra TaxID=119953 RepID=A0A8J2HY64_9PLEO|nr:uncharacterized protein ALTATR162_LOCUS1757 [Alternaria atra]CAG5145720.1 unnamed protein product [Alternaria atra]
MADPLSITASIITLIHVSVQVTVLVKQFRDEVTVVDATLTSLLNDVGGFQRVLESMKETIEENDNKETLQATGHVGNHWKNLARSLEDGADALQKLHATLDGVNKKTLVLDAPRKQLRLKGAYEQIARYREQIQTSHTAIQLSLSTIVLWNQVTFQKSTEMIPNKIVPTLDKLYDEFRTFGALLNAKIEKLQDAVADQNDLENYELMYMNNLRECVRSAADVVSTASTTLNADTSDKISVKHGSDFGDVFVKDANEPMLRWFASNTVYDFEDVEAPLSAPSEASSGDVQTEYQSDSDSDIENDLIRSLFNEGRKRKEIGDLESAIRYFRNCLTRFSSNASYTSLTSAKSAAACGVSKIELLEHLIDCYCLLEAWSKAKAIMKDKLFITERQVGKKDELYLRDTLNLAELMMKNREYVEAHLQARRSLRGFRKLGKHGNGGYEECLEFLIRICKTEGKIDEEEAYSALLASHERKIKRSASVLRTIAPSHDSANLQSAFSLILEDSAEAALVVSRQAEETPTHVHDLGSNEALPTETEGPTLPLPAELQVQPPESSQFDDADEATSEENSKSVSEREEMTSAHQYPIVSRPSPISTSPSTPQDYETVSLPGDDILASEQNLLTLVSQEYIGTLSTESATPDLGVSSELPATLTSPNSGDHSHLDVYADHIAAAQFTCMLYNAAADEATKKALKSQRRDARFLRAYCNLFHGQDPHYYTERRDDGYCCMIRINIKHGWHCIVSGYEIEQQAKDAAAAKACEMHISRADEMLTLDTMERRDPSSDKELCIPYDSHLLPETFLERLEGVGAASFSPITFADIPHITISAETDEQPTGTGNGEVATPTSENSTNLSRVRRSASDSKILPNQAAGQGLVEKFLASSTNDFERQALDRYQTLLTPLNLNAPKGAIIRRKVILLGDTLCGKSFLASTWSEGVVPEEDTPVMNHFIKSTKIKDRQVELVIWDNTGREGYEIMRRLSYDDAHIVLICFDIGDLDSFENIDYMWSVEVNDYLRDLPKILVGCKKDLRNDNAKLDSLHRQHLIPISPYAADRLAMKIHALAYFETSAIKRQGLSELFDYAAEASLRTVPKSKTSGIRKALSRGIQG